MELINSQHANILHIYVSATYIYYKWLWTIGMTNSISNNHISDKSFGWISLCKITMVSFNKFMITVNLFSSMSWRNRRS